MGMTIDNSCEPKPMSKEEIVDTLKTMVFGVQAFERFNAKERETLDKAWNIIDQYEARLKADMAAMLTEIQLDIEGQKFDTHTDKDVWNDAIRVCSDLIQQRINELKADQEGKE